MKQLIIRKKIRVHRIKRNVKYVAALAATICLSCSAYQMPVLAESEVSGNEVVEEATEISHENSVSYDIFHQHTGSEVEGGGCHQEVIYHCHQGDTSEGGACYQTPVYHTHEGNESKGGSCYGTAIYHSHSGSEESGGECYEAVYHEHTESCNVTQECIVTFVDVGQATSTTVEYCSHHGEITHLIAPAKAQHDSCGAGLTGATTKACMYCGTTGYRHTYTSTACGKSTSTVTGYQLTCGKTDTTPESYVLDCEKDAQVIDAYSLSCEKDEQVIDGYRLNCGWNVNAPVAKLVILNETEGSKESVKLSVKVEDLTGGKLNFTDGSFCWYDSSDYLVSQEDTVEIGNNGVYRVEYVPGDMNTQLTGLEGSIQVNNVYKPTPAPEVNINGSGENSESSEGSHQDTGENTEGGVLTEQPKETPTMTPVPTATPKIVPASTEEPGADVLHAGIESEDSSKEKVQPTATPTSTPTPTAPIPTPSATPVVVENMQDFTENEDAGEVLGQERKEGDVSKWLRSLTDFFAKPVVKVISVTTGTLLAAGVLGFCICFLRKTVKVYNDDGNGQMTCLGRCIVTREGEDFCITISEAMVEKSCTNRYAIRPGLFRLGRSEEQLLFVCKDKKRISVYLNKEMIVVI